MSGKGDVPIPHRPDAPGVSSSSAPAPLYDGRPRGASVVGFVLTLVATTLSLVVLIAVIASGWDGSPPSAGGPQPPDWVLVPWLWSAGIGIVALTLETIGYKQESKREVRFGKRLTSVGIVMCAVGAMAWTYVFLLSANASM